MVPLKVTFGVPGVIPSLLTAIAFATKVWVLATVSLTVPLIITLGSMDNNVLVVPFDPVLPMTISELYVCSS